MKGFFGSKEEFIRLCVVPIAQALSDQIVTLYYQHKDNHDYVTLILNHKRHIDIEVDGLDCVDITITTLKSIKEFLI